MFFDNEQDIVVAVGFFEPPFSSRQYVGRTDEKHSNKTFVNMLIQYPIELQETCDQHLQSFVDFFFIKRHFIVL